MFGFIIQPVRSTKTSWCQIGHLITFYLVLYSKDPLSTSQGYIPLGMLGGFWAKQKLPSFDVLWKFLQFRGGCYLTGREFMCVSFGRQKYDCVDLFLWIHNHIMSWSFFGILFSVWIEPSTPEVNIICCIDLWAALHKIFTIGGYLSFPNKWNCE